MLHNTKGIVLRVTKYGDTSVIASIYTELFGLQQYIVKGVRTISKKGASKGVFYQPAAILQMEAYHYPMKSMQMIKDVNFHVCKGEVVGIAGLMGAGRTELAMSIFGRAYGQKISGEVLLHGKPVDVSTIPKAMDAGLAYATEDRKTYGLVLIDHIKHNVTLANLDGVAAKGVVDDVEELSVANKYRKDLAIRCSSVFQTTVNLSGGNQQKVVLAKWLFSGPEVLILDEPTRGIDVGAKYEIYGIINELAEAGKAVIVISSEMPELLGISDRIYVMNDGRLVAEMPAKEASQEKIMRAIMKSWED